MKRFRTLACLTMMAVMAMGGAMAQDKTTDNEQSKRFEFSLHLGLRNMPVGPLADNLVMELDDYKPVYNDHYGRYRGGAYNFCHLSFGMKLKYNLRDAGRWAVIATADRFYITNSVEVEGNETYITSTGNGGYINIPMMVGVNYNKHLTTNLSFWTEAAIGLNYRRIKNRNIGIGRPEDNEEMLEKSAPAAEDLKWQFETFNSKYIYVETYDNALSVAIQIGTGIKWKRLSLGLHYYNLGWAPVKGSYSIQSVERNSDNNFKDYETIVADQHFNHEPLKTSLFVLRLGIHF